MRRDQLACNTISLRGPLEQILEAVAQAGFRKVELPLGQVAAYRAAGGTVAPLRLLQRHGLHCIGGFQGVLQPLGNEEERAANVQSLLEDGRLMAECGGGAQLNMVVGTSAPGLAGIPNGVERLAQHVHAVCAALRPLGISLLLEFNWGDIKSVRLAALVVQQSGAANAGILFDPAHYYCTAGKSEDLTDTTIAAIGHVHVNNMRDIPAELCHCNADRLLPDDPAGVLNLPRLFGRLEAGGYSGNFAIEMFSEELWALAPRDAARRLYQSMLPLCVG